MLQFYQRCVMSDLVGGRAPSANDLALISWKKVMLIPALGAIFTALALDSRPWFHRLSLPIYGADFTALVPIYTPRLSFSVKPPRLNPTG